MSGPLVLIGRGVSITGPLGIQDMTFSKSVTASPTSIRCGVSFAPVPGCGCDRFGVVRVASVCPSFTASVVVVLDVSSSGASLG